MFPNLHIVLLKQCAVTSLETWTSTEALSSTGDCLKQCFPELSDHTLEGLESEHGPFAGATAEIEVFVPINQYMGE